MKEIFDWLRERVKEASFPVSGVGHELVLLSHRAEEIINEAEAKWESECCEWKSKTNDMLGLYNTTCGEKSIVNPFWTHCPFCGKRIKISEVE